jgi:hypothetical protein
MKCVICKHGETKPGAIAGDNQAIRNRSYTNKVHLRGLKARFVNPRRRVLSV